MEEFKVAIIIPAYNEEHTIESVVSSVISFGSVIVVNDGSSDSTGLVAQNAGAIVVNHELNIGYDGALNSGFEKTEELGFAAAITFDADAQHESKTIPIFINKLKQNNDLILGVRAKTQRIGELVFQIYSKKILNWTDPLCGMKGYSLKLYKELGYFDSYHSIGTELAAFGLSNGYSSCEVFVPTNDREDKPRFSSLLKANLIIIRSLIILIVKNYKSYGYKGS
jgi:glycosyltransferase involved in cell wall biosynthesis